MRALVMTMLGAVVAVAACSTGEGDDVPAVETTSQPDAGYVEPQPDAGTPVVSACGNKKLDKGEECDDGNRADGDGCSSSCKRESAGPNDVCDGAPVALTQVGTSTRFAARITGTTKGLFDHYGASCGGGSAPDAVYAIDPPKTGRATVRISAGFPALVSARTGCEDAKTELACVDASGLLLPDGGAPPPTEVGFPVFAGKKTFLFVDGYGGTSGEFALDIDVQTAICGNGAAESPEACDDGNTTSGDGCSATCALEDTATPSACPGMGYRLGAGKASFAADTATLANGGPNATGCDSTGSGPNAIYAITPTVSGSLALRLVADYEGALLRVQRECADATSSADCRGATAARTPLAAEIPVTAEQTVYVYVDSSGASNKGLYVLDATLTAAACGNGKLDSGEECDDGNKADGDGCSATCAVERDPATYTCPGKDVRLASAMAGPRTAKVVGTTASAGGEPASKLSTCGSKDAPDVLYKVSSDIDGWLTAKVKGAFNATLQLRDACPGTTDLACAKAAGGNGQEVLSAAIDKDKDYFVAVDGALAGASGAFELELEVKPSVCGNGVVEGGETCDDGATADGDGCSATCALEADKSRDECATATSFALEAKAGGTYGATVVSGTTNLTKTGTATHSMSPCSSTGPDGFYPFVAPISGVVTARITSATFRSTIGVKNGCPGTQLTCDDANSKGGQEIVFSVTEGSTYYLQVGGGFVSGTTQYGRFTMDVSLVPTGCGDTVVSAPEACDDGNTQSGDGCSATCTVEALAGIGSCPGKALALTGLGTDVRRGVITVDTTPLASKTGSTCGGSGPEGVVAIISDIDGVLNVKASAGYAALLYARTTCADPSTEITKSSCSGSSLTSVSAQVTKNTPVYVFVDGMNGASGVAKLQITVTP